MNTRSGFCLAGLIVLCAVTRAQAGIQFDAQANAIVVTGFPQAMPCTPAQLLAADQSYGWGRVTHDPADNTWVVDADLIIGSPDGTSTWFQLGSSSHPNQTLRVRGHVVVSPYAVQREGDSTPLAGRTKAVNRLTIGVADDPEVKARLTLDSTADARRSVFVGALPDAAGRPAAGGQLHVHHGVITASTQDRQHALGAIHLAGDSILLDHAELSWVEGYLTHGISQHPSRSVIISNSTLAHGGTGFYNVHPMTLRNVTLRNLEVGLRDAGGLRVIAHDCTFADNDHHWTLTHSAWGVTLINCQWDEPRQPEMFRKWDHPSGQTRYPTWLSRRNIIVEVVDHAGRPIKGATVRVVNEQDDLDAVTGRQWTTDAAGRTPGKDQADGVLLHEKFKRSTDEPDKPHVIDYTYTIEASGEGFEPISHKGFAPTESWRVVRLTAAR